MKLTCFDYHYVSAPLDKLLDTLHNTTYLQEQGTDTARCVAFKGMRGCKIHAFCFQICQSSCFCSSQRRHPVEMHPGSAGVFASYQPFAQCLPDREASKCEGWTASISGSLCPPLSVRRSLSHLWSCLPLNESDVNKRWHTTHTDPAHAFTPYTQHMLPVLCHLLSESRRARMYRLYSLLLECHFIYSIL